jgi:serine/threonine-protein kinase
VEATLPPGRIWQPGEVLSGRYAIVGIVGEGGMGRVYRVQDALHPERDLALKMLSPSFLQALRVELFKAEFSTMSELSHPNIAKVYDFETIAGSAETFFTMEYIEGRDLLAASEGAPQARIIDWVVEACRALQYLHSRGVIHADFKPHNVMVTAAGHVKVLDFGLSSVMPVGLTLGTPAYMAPELGGGQPGDARADLYALGITLYQLLYRRPPFSGESPHELFSRHAHEPLRFPPEIPVAEAIRAVMARLCAKDPEDRHSTANAVIEALAAATGQDYAPETALTRQSYVSSGKLVGRESEKDELLTFCLARTQGESADEAVMAAIAGMSGVGKSRLMREVRRQLQLVGVPVVEASCYEGSFGELDPLQACGEALRRLCRGHAREDLEHEHAATLEWLCAGEPEAPHRSLSEEESLRMDRLRDLADFMMDVSQVAGFVLYINDLHWGRTATTDFLRILCEAQASRREAGRASSLALVASYREDEVAGAPLQGLLAAVDPKRRLEVHLAPLRPDHTAALIASMLGTAEVPDAFSARISEETGGNPFFIEETLRVLMERGDVHLQGGRWAARTRVKDLDLPPTIAGVLERRLSALGPWQREMLEWLGVYAQPMSLSVLVEASGRPFEAVTPGLRDLIERRLVASVGPEGVRPAHDELRRFVYEGQDEAARREKHASIAMALDRLAGGDGEYVFERAHHYWHAQDQENAYRWSEKAAKLGEQRFATDVAIDNYDRLGRLAEERAEEGKRRSATDRLLELCTLAGQYDRLFAVSDLELIRRKERLERARLYQLQGEALVGTGKLSEAQGPLRRATALLGGRVPRSRNARRLFIVWHYLRHVATLRFRRRDFALPTPMSDEGRRRHELLARSYVDMSICAVLTGDEEGLGVSFAGINSALRLGRHEVLCRLLGNVAMVHHILGRYARAERLVREAQRLVRSDGERALLLTIEVLCRQTTQRPLYPEQRPVQDHEAEMIRAVDVLSTRSKALFASVARTVATTILAQYAARFQYRPEIGRWAEAMHGTVHYAFVQGAFAAMALIDGQKRRAEEAFAQIHEGSSTPLYRALVSANFAYRCALTADTSQAVRCMKTVREILRTLEMKAFTSLWVPSLSIAACIAIAARGVSEGWLTECLEVCVAALGRIGRRLPAHMGFFLEVGRIALGRSTLAALTRAKERSLEPWTREQSIAGHPDACIAAALALRLAGEPAAPVWAEEAFQCVAGRFPRAYLEAVQGILRLPAAAAVSC